MVYEGFKVYGPYTRKDGRKHVILINDHSQKTVSYPKFIVENIIGRYLKKNETIDHIDRDFTNNDIDNLSILQRSAHAKIDSKHLEEQEFTCQFCGVLFKAKGKKLHDIICNRKKNKRGPFCSRSCAGKASHNIEDYYILKIVVKYTLPNKSLTEET